MLFLVLVESFYLSQCQSSQLCQLLAASLQLCASDSDSLYLLT